MFTTAHKKIVLTFDITETVTMTIIINFYLRILKSMKNKLGEPLSIGK